MERTIGAERRERLLREVYGDEVGGRTADELEQLLDGRLPQRRTAPIRWDERDAWLITYPDQFQRADVAPLAVLREVFAAHLDPWLNGLHVTPFFPWSSDDGYSVEAYDRVDERYGTWDDVEALAARWRLMVDAVVNHASARGDWFRRWQAGDPDFADHFVTADPTTDLSATVRPRTTPLLTPFETARGTEHVWTTFSADQVDLDLRTPRVLLRIVEVLLDYADHGAQVLRLDAIAFLWKQPGTGSIHLPQTHALVKVMTSAVRAVYPNVVVITETNVPHEDNVSYLGTTEDPEADAVYQFPLPPLVLHSFVSGDASALVAWLRALEAPVPGTTYLNFLASHDGVGVRPVEDLLTADEVARLVDVTRRGGGTVGERAMPDGTVSPYELNATWYALLAEGHEERAAVARHLASHAAMLALQGIPAIYVHSLVASDNAVARHRRTGARRDLNRGRFDADEFSRSVTDGSTRAGRVLAGMRALVERRRSCAAFHPDSPQAVVEAPPGILAVERGPHRHARARVDVNVTGSPVEVDPGQDWELGAEPAVLEPWSSRWLVD